MTAPKKGRPPHVVFTRVDQKCFDRLVKLRKAMQLQYPGMKVSFSDVVRQLIWKDAP